MAGHAGLGKGGAGPVLCCGGSEDKKPGYCQQRPDSLVGLSPASTQTALHILKFKEKVVAWGSFFWNEDVGAASSYIRAESQQGGREER